MRLLLRLLHLNLLPLCVAHHLSEHRRVGRNENVFLGGLSGVRLRSDDVCKIKKLPRNTTSMHKRPSHFNTCV
jgi:hypothetical protein